MTSIFSDLLNTIIYSNATLPECTLCKNVLPVIKQHLK